MHNPLIDLSTAEGAAIADLHTRIHQDVVSGDSWSGCNLVDLVDTWFRELGIDPDDSAVPGTVEQAEPSTPASSRLPAGSE